MRGDGEIDAEEQQLIKICLNSGTPRQHKETLRMANEEAYDEINFQIGYGLFFMTNGNANYMASATPYLEVAKNSRTLDPTNVTLSGYMYQIANSAKSSESKGKKWQNEYTYADHWKDLRGIAGTDFSKVSIGGNGYIIYIYNVVADQINKRCIDFKAAGVTEQQIIEVLDSVENGLKGLNLSDSDKEIFGEDYNEAMDAIDVARKMVAATYAKRGDE